MPRFIDNYKLESIQNVMADGLEHFVGKQNGSGQKFILKRFTTQTTFNTLSFVPKDSALSNQSLFHKLTHETLILKNLSHSSIPKCIRMLKTNNSIYFVWEFHPQMSLSDYLKKSWLVIEKKIQISLNILQTLTYLHYKNVAHCGLSLETIKVDEKFQIFLTNFKEAFKMETNQQNCENQQQLNRKKCFQFFLLKDIYDAAALLYEIFLFRKINSKIYVFSNDVERKLYEELNLILQKKISIGSLENLKRILSQKVNIRQTQCTESSEKAHSPGVMKSILNKTHLSRDSDLSRSSHTQRSSVSCSKITLQNALKRAENLRNEQKTCRQSKANLSSSVLTSGSKCMLKSRASLSENTGNKPQDQIDMIKSIIGNRRLIYLMLEFLNFIQKQKNLKLIYLLGLKCEFYLEANRKLVEECSNKYLEGKEIDFLKIVNSENLKAQDLVRRLKESIKEIVKEYFTSDLGSYETSENNINNGKASLIEQELSSEIFQYLERQMSNEAPLTYSDLAHSQKNQNTQNNFKLKVKRTESIFTPQTNNQDLKYKTYKFYYYLSIKLKYGSFEKFYERKNVETINFKPFQDDYFAEFERQTIQVDQIAEQVKARLERFGKKQQVESQSGKVQEEAAS